MSLKFNWVDYVAVEVEGVFGGLTFRVCFFIGICFDWPRFYVYVISEPLCCTCSRKLKKLVRSVPPKALNGFRSELSEAGLEVSVEQSIPRSAALNSHGSPLTSL